MKKLYRLLIIFFIVIMGFIGYNVWENAMPEPPAMTVQLGDKVYETKRGTYCWSTFSNSVCVDMIAPHEMKIVSVGTVTPASEIKLHFSHPPNSVDVQLWHGDYNYETVATKTTFTAPTEPGIYLYNVFARWHDKGDVSAIFQIEVQ